MICIDNLSEEEVENWNLFLPQLLDYRRGHDRLAGSRYAFDPKEAILVALAPLFVCVCEYEPLTGALKVRRKMPRKLGSL
jgi:hypothetical protein